MSGRGQGRVGAEGRRRGRRQTPLCPDARARFARCVLTRILRPVLSCVSTRGRRPACNVCARRTPPGPTRGLAVRLAVASGSSAHGTRAPARALGLVRVCERPREAPGAARPSCPALRARPARPAGARWSPPSPRTQVSEAAVRVGPTGVGKGLGLKLPFLMWPRPAGDGVSETPPGQGPQRPARLPRDAQAGAARGQPSRTGTARPLQPPPVPRGAGPKAASPAPSSRPAHARSHRAVGGARSFHSRRGPLCHGGGRGGDESGPADPSGRRRVAAERRLSYLD